MLGEFKVFVHFLHIACRLLAKVAMLIAIQLVQLSRLGRAALNQATRVQTLAGAFGKRIGKNRSVQEGLDMKIVAGLDKMGLFRKRWV